MTSVLLDGKKVRCSACLVSGNKNITSTPNANIDGPVEVQTQSYENLTITLQGVLFPTSDLNDTTYFRYEDLLDLYKLKYTGSNQKLLTVTYGGSTVLDGLTATAGIPVVIKSFNIAVNAKDTKAGYIPSGSIILVETE